MYCIKCEKNANKSDIQFVISRNGRIMKQGTCVICGMTKTQFIKAQEGGSLLNKGVIIYLSRCIFPVTILWDLVQN